MSTNIRHSSRISSQCNVNLDGGSFIICSGGRKESRADNRECFYVVLYHGRGGGRLVPWWKVGDYRRRWREGGGEGREEGEDAG